MGNARRAHRAECTSSFRLRSEEHTSELQSLTNLVCRLLLEKKKKVDQARPYVRKFQRKFYSSIRSTPPASSENRPRIPASPHQPRRRPLPHSTGRNVRSRH